MIRLIPLLAFSGNCREAFTFYKNCIGGTLQFQTLNDRQFPKPFRQLIVHATLVAEGITLCGTDLNETQAQRTGANGQLLLKCTSEAEIKSRFRKLSRGGVVTAPITETNDNNISGALVDVFGVHWVITAVENPMSGTREPPVRAGWFYW